MNTCFRTSSKIRTTTPGFISRIRPIFHGFQQNGSSGNIHNMPQFIRKLPANAEVTEKERFVAEITRLREDCTRFI